MERIALGWGGGKKGEQREEEERKGRLYKASLSASQYLLLMGPPPVSLAPLCLHHACPHLPPGSRPRPFNPAAYLRTPVLLWRLLGGSPGQLPFACSSSPLVIPGLPFTYPYSLCQRPGHSDSKCAQITQDYDSHEGSIFIIDLLYSFLRYKILTGSIM